MSIEENLYLKVEYAMEEALEKGYAPMELRCSLHTWWRIISAANRVSKALAVMLSGKIANAHGCVDVHTVLRDDTKMVLVTKKLPPRYNGEVELEVVYNE